MGENSDMERSLVVGEGDVLSFEDMSESEQVIITALEQAYAMGHRALHLNDLQAVSGWDGPTGNSKVRNNLRRLMRYGLIHRPLTGTYALTREPKVVAPDPTLVQIRPNPRNLNDTEARLLRAVEVGDAHPKMVDTVRKTDCALYDACLDQAISGKWAGFSCASCTAYAMPTQWQRECDRLALRALEAAAEEVEDSGRVNRKRGVKQGADAKRTPSE